MAASVDALRAGLRPRALACLSAALVLALAYPLVKFLEIGWNLDQGIGGNSGIFFTVYYLTFNHLVHASWGIIGMVWVLARLAWGAYTPEEHSGLEALGSYWHATDIIWLVIFPFLRRQLNVRSRLPSLTLVWLALVALSWVAWAWEAGCTVRPGFHYWWRRSFGASAFWSHDASSRWGAPTPSWRGSWRSSSPWRRQPWY